MISRDPRLRLITLAISLIFALGVAELGLRIAGYHPSSMDPRMFVAHSNPLLPYKLQHGYHGYYAGAEFTVDNDGNRRVLFEGSEQPQGKQRLLILLGDSVVFGQGLRDEDTIASQVERRTTKEERPYRIENIGVPGYTSWNEFAALTERLGTVTPSEVILIQIPNDNTFNNDYFGIGKGAIASYSGPETPLHRYTRFLYSHWYLAGLIRDTCKRLLARNQDSASVDTPDQSALAYFITALSRIDQLCKEKGISFSVGIYRDVSFFDDPNSWIEYEKLLQTKLTEAGIRFFVIKSHIERLDRSSAKVAWNDPHPSAKATDYTAQDILVYLKSNAARTAIPPSQ